MFSAFLFDKGQIHRRNELAWFIWRWKNIFNQ